MFWLVIACSCGPEVFSAPAAGDQQVPLDAEVVVIADWGLDTAPELRGPDDDIVEVDMATGADPFESAGSWWRLRPRANLQPATEYRIVIEGVERAFTTGTASEMVAPPSISVSVQAEYVPMKRSTCSNSCVSTDHIATLRLDLTRDDRVAYYELVFEGDERSSVRLAPPWAQLRYANTSCSVAPPALAPGDAWCVEVTAVTVSGGRSAPVTACAEVEHCASQPPCGDDFAVCEPRGDGCSTSGGRASWAALALVVVAMRRRSARG